MRQSSWTVLMTGFTSTITLPKTVFLRCRTVVPTHLCKAGRTVFGQRRVRWDSGMAYWARIGR